MLKKTIVYLGPESNFHFSPSLSYNLYGWLMECLPPYFAEQLHRQGETPVSQFIRKEFDENNLEWHINTTNEETAQIVDQVLDKTDYIKLNNVCLKKHGIQSQTIYDPDCFFDKDEEEYRLVRLNFLSPTTFKQSGNYVLYPQTDLIVKSLARKWNSVFLNYPMNDEDALEMLIKGIHISGYRLRSVSFKLKNIKINGFVGNVTLASRLTSPMQSLWAALLEFGTFSGIGIKTGLGMGGMDINIVKRYS